jgi:hypothetical protein
VIAAGDDVPAMDREENIYRKNVHELDLTALAELCANVARNSSADYRQSHTHNRLKAWRSGLDHVMLDRKPHQFCHRMHSQLAHHIGTVRFRSLHTDPERDGDLFVALAFCQKLNNFPLALSESLVDGD